MAALPSCVSRISGLGPRQWARSSWNISDGMIAVLGTLTWFIQVPAVSSLRLVRVARIITIINHFVEMQIILKSLVLSLPGLCNMLLLQVVLIFIFAVFGVSLFGQVQVTDNPFLERNLNFQNLWHAMPLLCLSSTCENWVGYMAGNSIDVVGCEEPHCGMPISATLYFHFFVISSSYIVMNIAVFIVTFYFEKISFSYQVCNQGFPYEIFQLGFERWLLLQVA